MSKKEMKSIFDSFKNNDIKKADFETDNSFKFDESFKHRTNKIFNKLKNNVDNTEEIIAAITSISHDLYTFIETSGKNIEINLNALRISDKYTFNHSIDVGAMAGILAHKLGFAQSFVKDATLAGMLHDIGKQKIPKEILNKTSSLTDEEFEIMKKHPQLGYDMIKDSKIISEEIKLGVLNHHENVDGTGYPNGIKDEEIGDIAKIISIVDAFDALVTDRPYRKAQTPAKAIEEMYSMSQKFDYTYFVIFLSIINAYPNGTIVQLSNNETAVVVGQNSPFPLRPKIKILSTGKIINLSTNFDYLSVLITN